MRPWMLVLLFALSGCQNPIDAFEERIEDITDLFDSEDDSPPPEESQMAMTVSAWDVGETLSALAYLTEALADAATANRFGYEVGSPDAEGRVTWRASIFLRPDDRVPMEFEGTAIEREPTLWEVEFRVVDERSEQAGTFEFRRLSAQQVELVGSGTYLESTFEWYAEFRADAEEPVLLTRPPEPPTDLLETVLEGCWQLRVEQSGEVLEALYCHYAHGIADTTLNGDS